MVEMGIFPNRILDNFRISPFSILDNFRISPFSILNNFRISPFFDFWTTFESVRFRTIQSKWLSNEIARNDKAIEVISEIIRTVLGC